MVHIFWGDHPFKLRVGVFGNFFWCARWRGLPKESHAGMAGGVVKIFRRSIIEGNARDCEESAKIPQKSRLVYIMHIMRHNKCAN